MSLGFGGIGFRDPSGFEKATPFSGVKVVCRGG